MNLKGETLEQIERVIPKYPVKRSAVMPLLHLIQEDQGYLSDEAIEWVASKLDLQPINIYELVTFYPFFRQQPIGRHHIRVCRTLPCTLVGAHKTCQALQEELNCKLGKISSDGEIMIEFTECLASCDQGPVVMVDEDFYEKVDEAKVKEIAARIKGNSGLKESVSHKL